MNYSKEKIKLVLNTIFPRSGLPREKIETAISYPITLSIPFIPEKFVSAINMGKPLVYGNPKEPISAMFEDFAFHLSKESDKSEPPDEPSEAWKRVYKRFKARRK